MLKTPLLRGFFMPIEPPGATFVLFPDMKYLFHLLLIPLFWSCEKDIQIAIKDPGPKLVVDASIENDSRPLVILTNSLDYFGKIDVDVLEKSFVHDAQVDITTGGATFHLKEYNVVNGSGTTIYYYSSDPTDPNGMLTGRLQTKYGLSIRTGGISYAASTTIPSITRRIDSLWWEPAKLPDDSDKVKMMIRATDKPGFGDYIRYYTKTNQESFFPGYNSVYDDQVIDGTTYTLPVDKATDRNLPRKDSDAYFNRGDSVILKLCNIDKATYDFWRTFEFSFQSVGNPFSSPTKVTSNISNGALGYFGGYAAQFRKLVIPPR
jgi:hypothetical protein